jgi:hypothetical protein
MFYKIFPDQFSVQFALEEAQFDRLPHFRKILVKSFVFAIQGIKLQNNFGTNRKVHQPKEQVFFLLQMNTKNNLDKMLEKMLGE